MDEIQSTMNSYYARLQTFQSEHHLSKRRASSQKKKHQSAAQWPHDIPTPEDLARAGFFYKPVIDSNDNVQCFLCAVKLDGWEVGDVPLAEHLAHSKECGYALSLSVQNAREERDPMTPELVLARTDTYGTKWPHEAKKGWRCKIQKMVDAGWSFDPSPDAEDGVTCFYCNLSLDGWEPKDNPFDEHRRRSPECAFFTLVEHYAALKPAKKGGRARASSTSKASRLSSQSIQSTFSEAPSLMSLGDAGADTDVEDSVAIDNTMTSDAGRGKKKTTKAKAPPKGKKKALRGQSVEPTNVYSNIDELSAPGAFPEDLVFEPSAEPQVEEEAPAPKPKRGRKAKAMEDSHIEEVSVVESARMTAKSRAKAKPVLATPARVSEDASQLQSELHDAASFASALQSPPPKVTRGMKRTSDGTVKQDENVYETIEEAPPNPKKAARAPAKGKKGKKAAKSADEESELDSAAVDASTDLKASQQETKPKRGRKPKKAVEDESPVPVEEDQPQPHVHTTEEFAQDDQVEEHVPTPAPEEFEPTPTPQKSRVSERPLTANDQTPRPIHLQELTESVNSTPQSVRSQQSSNAENQPPSSLVRAPPTVKAAIAAQTFTTIPSLQPTTQVFTSPTKTSRIPVQASTPDRSPSRAARSPQKQLGRLTSSTPWQPIDLETVFLPSPGKGNSTDVTARMMEVGGLLTSPEKQMSVEEWIRWRAEQAEGELKGECERMVGLFEKAGTKGLSVLDGVRTLET